MARQGGERFYGWSNLSAILTVPFEPHDAQVSGLTDGAYATIQSEVGQVRRRVKVTDAAQPGTAVLEGTWWGLSAPDGQSINTVTTQTLTDLGGGSTFHNTRVRLLPG